MGHQHILPVDHSFRCMKGPFDDREEHRKASLPPFGLEVYDKVKRLEEILENI